MARQDMTLTERQVQIAEMIRETDFLDVESLSDRFKVTTQTIRRDLNTLCDQGLARRRHGGVEKPLNTDNLTYSSRLILNNAAKKAIAREVARAIPNGASLAFSIGTTPEVVAEALLGHEALTIFTNNLNVAILACSNPSFEVTIVGGTIRNGDLDILGAEVSDFFAAYKVDFGIYGVAGVDEDGGLLDFHAHEVAARQAIRENCRQSVLVLDAGKFSRRAHVRGGRIEEADLVFCDRRPPEGIVERLAAGDATLTVCGPNGRGDR